VRKLINVLTDGKDYDILDYVDTSFSRVGQDVRYALDDSKLRALGWSPKKHFDDEIVNIAEYYKNKFIW
jgi:dTDP-D-glucose 4,6-dehydratase